jgi:threonine dehydratase
MIDLNDIQIARKRIAPYIHYTPLERNQTLSESLGCNTYLKLEIFQKTGSFKPRGAFNQILQLDEKTRARGVVAVSGGNFAQGVAYAGKLLGVEAVICMPEYTPANYIEATRSYGSRIELAPDFPLTFELASSFQKDGYQFLHAWDNPNMMAGNATIGLEILESLPDRWWWADYRDHGSGESAQARSPDLGSGDGGCRNVGKSAGSWRSGTDNTQFAG